MSNIGGYLLDKSPGGVRDLFADSAQGLCTPRVVSPWVVLLGVLTLNLPKEDLDPYISISVSKVILLLSPSGKCFSFS